MIPLKQLITFQVFVCFQPLLSIETMDSFIAGIIFVGVIISIMGEWLHLTIAAFLGASF